MSYQPTASDFEDISDNAGYRPSAEDFDDEEQSGTKPVEHEATKALHPKELTGWKGLRHDAVEMLRDSLKSAVSFGKKSPNMLKDLGGELLENPGTANVKGLGHVLAATADLGKGVLNLPHDVFSELGRKELIPEWLKKYNDLPFTHIPEDTGLEKFLGLDAKRPGQELLHAIPAIATVGEGVVSLAKAGKRALTAPSKETLFKRALEERINQAGEKTGMSESQLKDLQNALKLDYSKIHEGELGELNPVDQQVQIYKKNRALDKLRPGTEITEQHVGEIPEAPDTKAIVDEQKTALQKATQAAEDVIGIKSNPRLSGSKPVKKAIKEVHDTADALYKSGRQHYVDHKITADNTAEIKSVTQDLEALKDADELAPGYGSGTAEQKSLQAQIDTLKGEKVNATDIFDLQRTLEKMAEDTRKKQFSGVNDLEFKRLNGIQERLDAHADKLAKRLEEVGGKDVQKMIKEANKGWKIYKDLSNRNPVGKAALKGEIPIRSMIEIAKDHPGNDFLHALVESNPDLKKNMLAAYAGETNVNKLLKPTSLVKKYIESLPEVEEHVNALKQALQGVKEGEVEASKVTKEYNDLVKSMEDAAKEQKIRRDAIEQSDKLKKQIKFHEEAIPKIEAKMKQVETNSAEHKRLQKELKDHKNHLADKNHLLNKITGVVLKATGVSTLMHKVGL